MFKQIIVFGLVAASLAGVPKFLEMTGAGTTPADPPKEATRDEQSRPTAPAVQTRQTAPASYVTGVRSAQIKMDRSGHFAANFRINGQVVKGLVDTGATYVVMNMSTARKVGVHPATSDFRHQVTTANGIAKAAQVTISRMEIGPINIANVEAFVMEDKALSSTLIGMSFMSKLASYRVEGRALKLEN